jgi:hypothetical protein
VAWGATGWEPEDQFIAVRERRETKSLGVGRFRHNWAYFNVDICSGRAGAGWRHQQNDAQGDEKQYTASARSRTSPAASQSVVGFSFGRP